MTEPNTSAATSTNELRSQSATGATWKMSR